MRVKILKAEVENRGKYKQCNVQFFDVEKNREANTRLVSFGDTKDAFLVLAQAKEGEVFDVELKKNGDFWNWVSAKKVEVGAGNTDAPPKPSASPKSTYETPEERAARQVYIIRQSSLERAVDYFTLIGNKKATERDITALASFFVDFVINGNKTVDFPVSIETMDDDVPA